MNTIARYHRPGLLGNNVFNSIFDDCLKTILQDICKSQLKDIRLQISIERKVRSAVLEFYSPVSEKRIFLLT